MDWKNEGDYQYTLNHSLRDWGWEFIRRNKQYQEEWTQELKNFTVKGATSHMMSYLLNENDLSPLPSITSIKSEDDDLNTSEYVEAFPIRSENALKWGLSHYQNPQSRNLVGENRHSIWGYHWPDISKYCDEDGPQHLTEICIPAQSNTLIVSIDLSRPISKQIEAIEAAAKERKVEGKNAKNKITAQNAKKWKNYIRMLDAIEAKTTYLEAGKIILNADYKSQCDECVRYAKFTKNIGFLRMMA